MGGSITERVKLTSTGSNVLDISLKGSVYAAATYIVDSSGNQIDTFTIDTVDLDIRDLDSSTDSVTAYQGGTWTIGGTVAVTQSGTWILGANSGVDIGDVTINNAAGASAVNIQDGGNSITVDNAGLTELATAINASSQMDVNIAAAGVDVMLGTDFSGVFGSASLIRANQEDNIENTADGIQTTSFLYGFDGTEWDRLRGDASNGLLVNLGGNNDVTVSGTVSVNTLGSGTTGPQKAEDALSANQDVGIPAMAVQKATPANTAGTDGDYEFLQMSAGRLWASATIDAALPAGTNAIGKLAANSGVDIGDVDVTSISAGDNVIGRVKLSDGTDVADILDLSNSNPLTVAIVDGDGTQITSFGGGTQYTEDAAAAANPVGTALILIREDARGGSLTTTDGDNVAARGNNKGELYVKTTDSDALLTTIDADTSNISTKIDTLAGAVSGTEFQVDVLSMPTVTVNAHNVTNAGTFAVQVDGAALTALQLIDDVVYIDDADWTDNTSKHLLVGGVYQSAPHTVTDGDVTPFLTDVNGRLIAAVTDNGGSLTVDNAGLTELAAAINASSQLDVNIAASAISFGGTSAADDADFTATTTLGTPAMGVYESTPTNVTDGDMGIVGITQGRRLKTSSTIDAALPAGTNAIGKLAANSGVDIGDVDILSIAAGDNNIGNVDIASIAAGDNNIGNVDIVSLPASTNTIEVVGDAAHDAAVAGNPVLIGFESKDFDGAALPNVVSAEGEAVRAAASLYGVQYVMMVSEDGSAVGTINVNSHAVTNAGTFAVQDATAQASLSVMDDWDNAASDGASVSGDVAHDTADAGEPVKVGYKAYSPDGTTPGTAVAENDRSNGKSDLDGRQFVSTEHPRWWSYHVDGSSALTDATVQADPGDGFQIVITNIVFSSGAATAINMFLEEGASKIMGPWYLEAIAGRGMTWTGEKHVTASTAVTITTSAAIAHSVDIQGYIQAV